MATKTSKATGNKGKSTAATSDTKAPSATASPVTATPSATPPMTQQPDGNAIDALKQDHRRVEQLFAEFEEEADEDELVDGRPWQHDRLEQVVGGEHAEKEAREAFQDLGEIHGEIMNGKGRATIPAMAQADPVELIVFSLAGEMSASGNSRVAGSGW